MATARADAPPSAQAQAHILAQAQLRAIAVQGVTNAWEGLPSYDEESVGPFLSLVVPLILAAQRRSAALTNAFLARSLGRPPVGMDIEQAIGPAIRNGIPPETVYRRPFVAAWSALKQHAPWEEAVRIGLERATGAAAMDVQNTMRHTLVQVGMRDDLILGYRRVPDADACPFCRLIAGRRYLVEDLLPVHPRCGCGVDVITAENRGGFSGKAENDLAISPDGSIKATIAHHGELGPLLVNADHSFRGPEALAA